jgi:hypothetical protein
MKTRNARRPRGTALLVATRKGAFIYRSDPTRRRWTLDGPHLLGQVVHHLVLDPRDGRTLLMAARTGHLGPTIFRSTAGGRTWTEAKEPPAFPKVEAGVSGTPKAVDHTFWLTPGLPTQPGVWWAGTSPQGLFRSEDGGVTWEHCAGFERDVMGRVGPEFQQTPDGAVVHSLRIDPRDPRHLYAGLSGGGVFESRDGAESWRPLNAGVLADFLPDKYPEVGQDPHIVDLHPLRPDRLYEQNHCGIYRLDRGPDNLGDRWVRIGERMPKKIGDIGFPIVPTRCGCSRWTGPRSGPARAPVAAPPPIARGMRAGAGSDRTRDCRRQTRGGRSSGRPCVATPASRSAST